jgi:hypothetical protein
VPAPLAGFRIEKAINAVDPFNPTAAEDADDPNNPASLVIGTDVVWTYLVINDSDVTITVDKATGVVDDHGTPNDLSDDFHPLFVSGDTQTKGRLSPGEVWLFTSAGVIDFQVQDELYGNLATVTGTADGVTATDDDPNFHGAIMVEGVLRVEKAINAANPNMPTLEEDADSPGDPRIQPVGTDVVWTYQVVNEGNAALQITDIRDDFGTPKDPDDDFSPLFVGGDQNNDGLLDPGEVWLYTSEGVVTYAVVPGLFTNLAAVEAVIVGTETVVFDDDPNSHRGPGAAVRVEKAINAVDPSNPTTLEDADKAPGPALVTGTDVVWTYQVLNNGDTTLEIASLVDDFGTPNDGNDDFTPAPILAGGFNLGDADQDDVFDPGETWLFTSQGAQGYAVQAGPYVNRIDVLATAPDETSASDFDLNHHIGQANGEGLTPGFWKNNAAMHDAVAWPRDALGDLIYDPSQTVASVFSAAPANLAAAPLSEALDFGGGGANALLRHAVAALLNATHPEVAYPLTAPQIIAQVNAALASGNSGQINALKNRLDGFNTLGSDLDQHGNTQNLVAAQGRAPSLEIVPITDAVLAPIVDEAVARWQAVALGAGLDADDLSITVEDLSGNVLGHADGDRIVIDADAAGYGWFIDATPADDQEFAAVLGSTELLAVEADAVGRMDLLTIVMHEIGHVIGLDDLDPAAHEGALMAGEIEPGVRKLPLEIFARSEIVISTLASDRGSRAPAVTAASVAVGSVNGAGGLPSTLRSQTGVTENGAGALTGFDNFDEVLHNLRPADRSRSSVTASVDDPISRPPAGPVTAGREPRADREDGGEAAEGGVPGTAAGQNGGLASPPILADGLHDTNGSEVHRSFLTALDEDGLPDYIVADRSPWLDSYWQQILDDDSFAEANGDDESDLADDGVLVFDADTGELIPLAATEIGETWRALPSRVI